MLPPGTIEAFGLYLVRTSAMVLAAPLLGTGATFSGYKVGLIALISFLLYSVSGAPLADAVLPIEYAIFVMREIMIGLFLAFALQVVVLAARIGGDLIGHEMAFNMSNVVDPVSGVSTPLIASMYEMFFFLGVLALNGHHWLHQLRLALGHGALERQRPTNLKCHLTGINVVVLAVIDGELDVDHWVARQGPCRHRRDDALLNGELLTNLQTSLIDGNV